MISYGSVVGCTECMGVCIIPPQIKINKWEEAPEDSIYEASRIQFWYIYISSSV